MIAPAETPALKMVTVYGPFFFPMISHTLPVSAESVLSLTSNSVSGTVELIVWPMGRVHFFVSLTRRWIVREDGQFDGLLSSEGSGVVVVDWATVTVIRCVAFPPAFVAVTVMVAVPDPVAAMVRTPPEILAVATAVLLGVAMKVRPSPVNHPLRWYPTDSVVVAKSTAGVAPRVTVGLLVVVEAITVTVI